MNLTQLLGVASLDMLFKQEIKTNKELGINWAIVVNWSEESRYVKYEKRETEEIFNAISLIKNKWR
jgi:hypothetical protein